MQKSLKVYIDYKSPYAFLAKDPTYQLEIDFGVEINPHKCGTYYPGTKIPVYHQDDMDPPDYFLLLSWNFKTEILSKIKPILDQGTKVIVAIPKPEII